MSSMATSQTIAIFLLSILLSFAAPSNAGDSSSVGRINPTRLILKTCNKTTYNGLCVDTLSSSVKAGRAGNIRGLVNIGIEGAVKKATQISQWIGFLMNLTHPSGLELCIRRCSKNYEDCYNLAQHALDVIWIPGNINKAIRCMNIAIDSADICEQGCLEMNEKGSHLLTSRNVEFQHMCTTAAEIIMMLPESRNVTV